MSWIPITELVCDVCGEPLDCAAEGRLEWLQGDNGECNGFRVVHDDPSCRYAAVMNPQSQHLDAFCGPGGLTFLLHRLASCTGRAEGAGDLFKRLQLPHYEQDRQRRFLGDHLDPTDPELQFD